MVMAHCPSSWRAAFLYGSAPGFLFETVDGRRYDLVPTIQQYVKYLSDKAYGKDRSEKELELREQKMKADIALKESQGELHRLKTDIAAGAALFRSAGLPAGRCIR